MVPLAAPVVALAVDVRKPLRATQFIPNPRTWFAWDPSVKPHAECTRCPGPGAVAGNEASTDAEHRIKPHFHCNLPVLPGSLRTDHCNCLITRTRSSRMQLHERQHSKANEKGNEDVQLLCNV